MTAIYVLNGPNLQFLGTREPEVYGSDSLADAEALCREAAGGEAEIVFRQTDAEHELVGWLHEARERADGVVINAAGFSYYAVAVLDALKMLPCPAVEVHVSNVHRREEAWRSESLMTAACEGMITGLGVHGYALAVRHLLRR